MKALRGNIDQAKGFLLKEINKEIEMSKEDKKEALVNS